MTSKTAVLFIIFNRVETTKKVFEAIRAARPEKLYIAADGPRKESTGDEEKCMATRNIVNHIDWNCEVKKLFQDKNIGSKYGVIAALDWFFENEESGIILEDDCLPSPDFFRFSNGLLEYYKNDHRVMHIGGTNLQFGQQRGNASYYFSRIASIWGWASWRRVWQRCDHKMSSFPQFEKQDQMTNLFPERRIADWMTNMSRNVYEEKVMTWDYPYAYSIACNNGLCITPNINLVSNIGFGNDATRTKDVSSVHASIPIGQIREITHPVLLVPDTSADLYQLSLSVDDIKKSNLPINKKRSHLRLAD